MKARLTLLLVVVLTVGLLFAACGKKEAADNTFKVGMECGYAPYNWTQEGDANGAVKIDGSAEYANGYDVQMAKKIADGLGKKLVIVKTKWDGLSPALVSGTIDAIIAGMSPTAERKKTIDFTDKYYTCQLVIVVKADGKYANATSLDDFKGAKITAQLNTLHYSLITQIPGVLKQTAMDSFPAMRVALESGVIDGYVSERPEGISAQAANNHFKMIELTKKGFTTAPEDVWISVGVRKGYSETAKINEILAGITEAQRTQIMDDAVKHQPTAN